MHRRHNMRPLFRLLFLALRIAAAAGLKPMTLFATMMVDDFNEFSWQTGTFEAVVELVLASEQGSIGAAAELSTIDEENEPRPFSDISFDVLGTQAATRIRWIAKVGGDVLTSKRKLRVKSRCSPVGAKYPFETTTCTIRLVSNRLSSEELTLQWARSPSPIRRLRVLTAPGAEITAVLPVACTFENTYSASSLGSRSAGHSCLEARFTLRRPLFYFLLRYALPAVAAVFVLWISFFVSRANLLLRFFMISSAVFTQTILSTCLNYASPAATSITPADVWNFAHFLVLAACIFHFGVLVFIQNAHKKYHDLAKNSDFIRTDSRKRYERKAGKKAAHNVRIGNGNGAALGSQEMMNSFEGVVICAFREHADKYSLWAARWDIAARTLLLPGYALLLLFFYLFLFAFDAK